MCVQSRGGVQDHGGYHTCRGGGGGVVLSTVGDVHYRGGYHDKFGRYLSTVGGYQEHHSDC